MTYWPGTKIRRSTGNAFDWRGDKSVITSQLWFKQSQHSQKLMAGKGSESAYNITIKKVKK